MIQLVDQSLLCLPFPHTLQIEAFLRLTNELVDVATVASSSSERDERKMRDVMEALLPLLGPGNEADGTLSVITTFVQLLQQAGAALLESIRRLGGHCACLPSHQSSWEEMEVMISATVNAMETLCQGNNSLGFSRLLLVSPLVSSLPLTRALTQQNKRHSARHAAFNHSDGPLGP